MGSSWTKDLQQITIKNISQIGFHYPKETSRYFFYRTEANSAYKLTFCFSTVNAKEFASGLLLLKSKTKRVRLKQDSVSHLQQSSLSWAEKTSTSV